MEYVYIVNCGVPSPETILLFCYQLVCIYPHLLSWGKHAGTNLTKDISKDDSDIIIRVISGAFLVQWNDTWLWPVYGKLSNSKNGIE